MEYVKEITVNLSGENLYEYINAVQGDNARKIKVKIMQGALIFTPPAGATAVLRGKKPDGNLIFNDCIINPNGTITALLTSQITAVPGLCHCEITVYGADVETLTTVKFIINVTPSAIGNSDITSTDEFQALAKAINALQDASDLSSAAKKTANEALETIDRVEASINTATNAANAAASNANTKATLADEKATAAYAAAESANTAASNANEKAVLADEKATAANFAAQSANTAASNANEKAALADEKATAANSAAQSANTAASNANEKAALADEKATAANSAAESANNAANNANTATTAANTAASNANEKAALADEKATAANSAAQAANTAANNAVNAALTANNNAAYADQKATAAETAATRANTAAEQAEAIIAQASELVTRYGVKFGGDANSGATVERLYNAVGLVAGVGTDTETAENDFDNIYPWNARRRCCGEWDETTNEFVVHAYEGEPGYAVDGSNGEVWVEHSLWYFKHEYTETGGEIIVISATPLAGFKPAPIFDRGENPPFQKAYTAAYPMKTIDGKPTSRSGVFSDLYSLNTAMAAAKAGSNNYIVTTSAEQYTECLYMWVEFATRHMQSIMQGACSMPYGGGDKATVAEIAANRVVVANATANKFVLGQTIGIGTSLGSTGIANNRVITSIDTYDENNKAISFDGDPVSIAVDNVVFSLAWKNGSCDNVISSSGSAVSNTDGKHTCIYRGKETPYGNAFEAISDILIKREGAGTAESPYTYTPYVLPNPTLYSNGTITDNYIPLNYKLPTVDGYAKTLGYDSRYPFVRMPIAIGASTTTRYSDYYYYPRYPVSSARVGGGWNNGVGDGPSYWNCNNAPSDVYVYYRARLSRHRE